MFQRFKTQCCQCYVIICVMLCGVQYQRRDQDKGVHCYRVVPTRLSTVRVISLLVSCCCVFWYHCQDHDVGVHCYRVDIITWVFIVTVRFTQDFRLLSGYVIVGLILMFCPHDYCQGMLLQVLCCYIVQYQRRDHDEVFHCYGGGLHKTIIRACDCWFNGNMFCPHDYRQGMLLLLLCCYFVQFQRQDNYVAVHYFRVVFTTSQDDCSVVSVLVLIQFQVSFIHIIQGSIVF